MELTLEQKRALALASARARAAEQVTPAEPGASKIVPEQNMSALEQLAAKLPSFLTAGDRQVRGFVQGAADPSVGLFQLGANLIGKGEGVNAAIKKQNDAYKARAGEGLDVNRLVGNVLSPANILLFKGAPVGQTIGGRAAIASALGAAGGAMNPETGEDYTSDKLKSIGLGAALGPAAELAGAGVSKVVGAVAKPVALAIDSVLPGGTDRAAKRMLRETAGDKSDEIATAIAKSLEQQKSSPLKGYRMTTAEAAEPAGSYKLSGLEKVLRTKGSIVDEAGAIERGNRASMVDAIASFAKTPKDVEAAKVARGEAYRAATDPIWANRINTASDADVIAGAIDKAVGSKQAALQEAGKFATSEAENLTRAANFTPVPGMPRVSGRASNFPERAAEAASATKDAAQIYKDRSFAEDFLRRFEGLYDPSGAGLASMLERPSIQKALSKASELARESGRGFSVGETMSVKDAQNMKMVLDDLIKDPKTFGLGASEVQAIQGTRGKFMEWLASKSPEWNAARAGYAQASKPINEMEVGQELLKALRNTRDADLPVRASTFQAAVENAPKTIKSGTDRQVANSLEEALAPQNMEAVNAVSEAIARQSRLAEAGREGAKSAMEMLRPGSVQLPNALDQRITIINALIRRASGMGGEKAEQRVAELLVKSPEKVAELLKTMPPGEAEKIMQAIMQARAYGYQVAPQVGE